MMDAQLLENDMARRKSKVYLEDEDRKVQQEQLS